MWRPSTRELPLSRSRSRPSTWEEEIRGLKLDQVKRLKDLERENSKLKRLVAELSTNSHDSQVTVRNVLRKVQTEMPPSDFHQHRTHNTLRSWHASLSEEASGRNR
jgi:hypothetical protein